MTLGDMLGSELLLRKITRGNFLIDQIANQDHVATSVGKMPDMGKVRSKQIGQMASAASGR